jgi:hypothetical protein
VEEMSRYVSKKGTSRIFLMLNLKEIGGSNPELMAYYIRHQIQPRITRVPLAVLMIRSNDHQVMKIVENEIKDTTSDKVSIHSTFEEALRHIGYVIKCEHLKKPQSFISRFYAQITQLF